MHAYRSHTCGQLRASDVGASVRLSGWIHRKHFELAVLAQVKDELKSGDLYIPHGERYDDYREQLGSAQSLRHTR